MKKHQFFLIAILFFLLSLPAVFSAETTWIKITYPVGGEIFLAGQTYVATWDYNGNLNGPVSVNLIYGEGRTAGSCLLGTAPIEAKKLAFSILKDGPCKNALTDNGKYKILVSYKSYYASTGSFLDLSSQSDNYITLRLTTDGICGSSMGQSFSVVPTTGLCNFGELTEEVSVYEDAADRGVCATPQVYGTQSNDGNWNWKCSGVKCSANDPNKALKLKFKATEIISYTGTIDSPDSIEYWAEDFCPPTKIPDGYELVSCSHPEASDQSSHGSSSCAVLSKIKIRKPVYCTQQYAPVCGKNGKTYPNECYAKNDVAEISYVGECTSKINGVCGSASLKTATTRPSSGLCQSGIAGTVSKYSPWTWVCKGINGGTDASCSAKTPEPENTSQKLGSITIDKPLDQMTRDELIRVLLSLLAVMQSNKN
ncbi:MAG: Kazal-type serine protease inhibitor [Candidatus Paceibacterota bacterium]